MNLVRIMISLSIIIKLSFLHPGISHGNPELLIKYRAFLYRKIKKFVHYRLRSNNENR